MALNILARHCPLTLLIRNGLPRTLPQPLLALAAYADGRFERGQIISDIFEFIPAKNPTAVLIVNTDVLELILCSYTSSKNIEAPRKTQTSMLNTTHQRLDSLQLCENSSFICFLGEHFSQMFLIAIVLKLLCLGVEILISKIQCKLSIKLLLENM